MFCFFFQIGHLYKFTNFFVRPAPRSKNVSDSFFEIELRSTSNIIPVEGMPEFAPLLEEKFTELAKIKLLPDDVVICKF